MTQLFYKNIAYKSSSEDWFSKLAGLAHPVWLDSSNSERGRYDILSAEPVEWIALHHNPQASAKQLQLKASDFLDRLRTANARHQHAVTIESLPFTGGIIGQLGYDFGRQLMGVASSKETSTPIAEAGVYEWAIVQDHRLKRCTFVCCLTAIKAEALLNKLFTSRSLFEPLTLSSELSSNLSRNEYTAALARIRDYTLDGDCYQINYSKQYSASYQGHPADLYLKLRNASSGPFSAYFHGECSTTLSMSPERLVSVKNDELLTQPIKGTAPRSSIEKEDKANAESLKGSTKDQAENVMIVDLLRNDFGKVCTPGSIQVPQLFELQSFSAVHHLVSSISGTLKSRTDALDLLKAVFPGGSITGAPKRRAMEIIEELEPHARRVYCGSIFYLSSTGQFDSNILIRTVFCENDTLFCWGGGGIVLDSTADAEWLEINDKIGNLLTILGDAQAPEL
ncbi:MAG: anthranilate synthase component I family protein [Pseudomonadales bacterium]